MHSACALGMCVYMSVTVYLNECEGVCACVCVCVCVWKNVKECVCVCGVVCMSGLLAIDLHS